MLEKARFLFVNWCIIRWFVSILANEIFVSFSSCLLARKLIGAIGFISALVTEKTFSAILLQLSSFPSGTWSVFVVCSASTCSNSIVGGIPAFLSKIALNACVHIHQVKAVDINVPHVLPSLTSSPIVIMAMIQRDPCYARWMWIMQLAWYLSS